MLEEVQNEIDTALEPKQTIDILVDVNNDEIEERLPVKVRKYMIDIRNRLRNDYAILNKNKARRMLQAKAYYDRRNKKISYELGDLVLVNHPEIKKGMSRSLAPKYYGPFEIVGKYKNGCDYLIKEHGHPRARVKQIHNNRLIAYHKRGHPSDKAIETHESTHEQDAQNKRKYNKNPNCSRWSKKQTSDKIGSSLKDSSNNEQSSTDEVASTDFEIEPPKMKNTSVVDHQR
jgi:hypothetical protein